MSRKKIFNKILKTPINNLYNRKETMTKNTNKNKTIAFRVSEEEMNDIIITSKKHGFRTYSELARFLLLNVKDIDIKL